MTGANILRVAIRIASCRFTGMRPTTCAFSAISVPYVSEGAHASPSIRKMSTEGGLPDEEINRLCHEPDEATKDFIMQQTMYRIKDPKRSLEFYTKVLGMRLLQKFDFPAMTFSLYFMGYENPEDIPKDRTERTRWMFKRKATIELTHNWGTEKEESEVYHNGNKDPRGYG